MFYAVWDDHVSRVRYARHGETLYIPVDWGSSCVIFTQKYSE